MSRRRLDFILIELQLASRFLEIAEAACNPETRARNLENAQLACNSAQDVLATIQCSDEQRAEMRIRLASIQDRLDAEAKFPSHPGFELDSIVVPPYDSGVETSPS
jgi:hypothetical protein